MSPARYVNPYTDFGFKTLFGQEANKDLLIDFLNSLLPPGHNTIAEISFRGLEKLPRIRTERKAVFDIACVTSGGERFIVEMQQIWQLYFKDRTVFYSTFPIREQAVKGEWNFQWQAVYCVGILDFYLDEGEEGYNPKAKKNQKVRRNVMLREDDGAVFYDKLRYIFLQMPAFKKKAHQLKTRFDKWLYFLKNLEDFNEIPAILREPIFEKGFHVAEVAGFSYNQMIDYEKSLMRFRDWHNTIDSANQTGRDLGRKEGEEIGIRKGEEIGIRKGEEMAMKKALSKLMSHGMSLEEAKKMLGM